MLFLFIALSTSWSTFSLQLELAMHNAMVTASGRAVDRGGERRDVGTAEHVVDPQQGEVLRHQGCRPPRHARACSYAPVGVHQAGREVGVGRLALGDVEIAQEKKRVTALD